MFRASILFNSSLHHLSPLQDQRERKASKSHLEDEVAKPAEMDKTPKKNPFVPLQVNIVFGFFVLYDTRHILKLSWLKLTLTIL